tara:strand:+ start:2629 stop:3366 length:738 start_codon:yes stop_codon:yes gene_type:complete
MKKTEKGFAMVLALVLLLAMSLMGGALILISSSDHQSNNNSDQYQQTFYAAEMALLAGEQYVLNEKMGPWDNRTLARDATKKNLPSENTTKFTGTMFPQNYAANASYKFSNTRNRKFINTGNTCFNSYRDIIRDDFYVVKNNTTNKDVAYSYNLGVMLENTFKYKGEKFEKDEAVRMKNYYYEYFIERIGPASMKGTGSSIKSGATDASKSGLAYRVYGCGIYGPEKEKDRMIVSLESVVVLPKN